MVQEAGKQKMNVLVVAAHPDDEVLGCGGTIARLAQEGHPVDVAVLGEGITARLSAMAEKPEPELQALRESSRRAASLLGVRSLIQRCLPDNRFDTLPLLDIVRVVEELVAELKPQVVFSHHGGDLNVDHAITSRAVLTATRPMTDCAVRQLLAFEVNSSTEWAFHQFIPTFRPNVFVEISETLDRKVQAMKIYGGEIRPFPHPRSEEALRALAARRGSMAGVAAAEAFELVRDIRPLSHTGGKEGL